VIDFDINDVDIEELRDHAKKIAEKLARAKELARQIMDIRDELSALPSRGIATMIMKRIAHCDIPPEFQPIRNLSEIDKYTVCISNSSVSDLTYQHRQKLIQSIIDDLVPLPHVTEAVKLIIPTLKEVEIAFKKARAIYKEATGDYNGLKRHFEFLGENVVEGRMKFIKTVGSMNRLGGEDIESIIRGAYVSNIYRLYIRLDHWGWKVRKDGKGQFDIKDCDTIVWTNPDDSIRLMWEASKL